MDMTDSGQVDPAGPGDETSGSNDQPTPSPASPADAPADATPGAGDASPQPPEAPAEAAPASGDEPAHEEAAHEEAAGDDASHEAQAHDEATPQAPPAPPAPKAAGTIQAIEDEDAVITLEDGRTARMRKVDLADAQGKIHAQVGDRVEGGLHEEADGTLRLKKRSARAEAIAALADVFSSKTPIDGRVTHAVKGGFEVRINGIRAFCPTSQLSLRRDDIQGDPMGQTFPFVLTKWDPDGRSLVVSRRKLLEREQKKLAADAKTRITAGARLTGRVVGFQPYGAFVDLGGIQGLLHVSEMSHARIQDPKSFVSMGKEIEVLVLHHDEGFKKVSLSMKALEKDPWEAHGETLQPGRIVKGTCKRVASVGAFIELFPALEGLMPARIPSEGESDLPKAGDETLVRIVDVEPRRHRVTLAPAPEGANEGDTVEAPAVEPGARVEGFVDHVAQFGIFVRLQGKKAGLLHASESKVPHGADMAAAFPVGARVMVEILDISEDGQKIRLTRRNAAERALAAATARPAPRQQAGPGGGGPGGGGMGGMGMGGGRDERERGQRRPGGGPGGGGGRPGGFGGQGGRPGGPGGPGGFGGRPGGGERRPRRDAGPPAEANPAAAPRSGFAVIGDAFRAKLAAREQAAREAAEAAAAAEAGDSEPTSTDDQPSQ